MAIKREIAEIDFGLLKSVIVTDQGNTRDNNEDAYRVASDPNEKRVREKGCLLVVADGMGGHAAGEVASKIAVDTVVQEYFKCDEDPVEDLKTAFQLANQAIFERSIADKLVIGMGTTCTALVVIGQDIYFAHVGDTRAYLLKHPEIFQLTNDHTYVAELLRKGVINKSEVNTHPRRNVLTQAMGLRPEMAFESGKAGQALETDNRLIICSDGLYEYVEEDELSNLSGRDSILTAAVNMVDLALSRGGRDNITIVIAEKRAG